MGTLASIREVLGSAVSRYVPVLYFSTTYVLYTLRREFYSACLSVTGDIDTFHYYLWM